MPPGTLAPRPVPPVRAAAPTKPQDPMLVGILQEVKRLGERVESLAAANSLPTTLQIAAESQEALAAARLQIASLLEGMATLQAANASLSGRNATLERQLAAESARSASLTLTVAEKDLLLDNLTERRQEIRSDMAEKCVMSQPLGRLTYSAVLKRIGSAPSVAACREIKTNAYWPQDDVTMMVTTGMAGSIGKRRDDLTRAGLPREAVINIKSLYASYSLLSTPTSMQDAVMTALEKLNIDVVSPEDARVSNIPCLSPEGQVLKAKQTSKHLSCRLAALISGQRYTLAAQLRQISTQLELPIGSQKEVEEMAHKGTWRKPHPTDLPACQMQQQLLRNTQAAPEELLQPSVDPQAQPQLQQPMDSNTQVEPASLAH
ncbi:hypothetical protein EV174_004799 [Coemansia sp. RSA 2320]|nr:hypothetical protein EV174_004799 [Coemansia sp. RSA 2320]